MCFMTYWLIVLQYAEPKQQFSYTVNPWYGKRGFIFINFADFHDFSQINLVDFRLFVLSKRLSLG